MLRSFIHSDAVFRASITFLHYRIFGLFFACGVLLFRSFYTGITFTKYLSISSGIMAGVNVLLEYAMIFGHWGFRPMGIAGAGLASSIAEVVALLFFVMITFRNSRLKKYELFRLVKPEWVIVKNTLGISVFVMIQYVISLGSWFIFFMFIEKMGERPLAVSNIIRSLYMLIMIPAWALCSVTNTLVSNALGEGKPAHVIPLIKRIMKICIYVMLVMVAVGACFPRQAISIYTSDPSLIEAVVPSYYIILAALFNFSIMSILFNGVLGTANTNVALAIEASTLSVYLVFAWLVAVKLHLKIEWVWTAEFVYSSLIGALSYLYLKNGKWRDKVL